MHWITNLLGYALLVVLSEYGASSLECFQCNYMTVENANFIVKPIVSQQVAPLSEDACQMSDPSHSQQLLSSGSTVTCPPPDSGYQSRCIAVRGDIDMRVSVPVFGATDIGLKTITRDCTEVLIGEEDGCTTDEPADLVEYIQNTFGDSLSSSGVELQSINLNNPWSCNRRTGPNDAFIDLSEPSSTNAPVTARSHTESSTTSSTTTTTSPQGLQCHDCTYFEVLDSGNQIVDFILSNELAPLSEESCRLQNSTDWDQVTLSQCVDPGVGYVSKCFAVEGNIEVDINANQFGGIFPGVLHTVTRSCIEVLANDQNFANGCSDQLPQNTIQLIEDTIGSSDSFTITDIRLTSGKVCYSDISGGDALMIDMTTTTTTTTTAKQTVSGGDRMVVCWSVMMVAVSVVFLGVF